MGVLVDVRCDECYQLASDVDGVGSFPSVATAKRALAAHGWYFGRRIRCPDCIADDKLIAERVDR